MSDQDPLFNLAFDPAYTFGSEAANLEYSILSAILGNPSPPDDNSRLLRSSEPHSQAASSTINGSSYPQFANPEWPAPPPPPPEPPTSSKAASPVLTPNFLHQQTSAQDPRSYPPAVPYQPPLAHGQSYNSASMAYQTSPSTIAPPSELSLSATQPLQQQPHTHMHYPQSTWSEATPSAPSGNPLSATDTSYMRTHVSSQQSVSNYVNTQGQGGPAPNQGLPPLSPPPSNSSPGSPLATENGFSFHPQSHSIQNSRQQVAPLRSSQLYQTAHWGFTRGPEFGSAVENREDVTMFKTDGSSAQKIPLPSSVYNAVTKPYDYMQGYHDVMRHLHERYVTFIQSIFLSILLIIIRFESKIDILRVVRALAIVRPSLIALQMALTEEDEIFVEKCFQRSLIVRPAER